VQLNVISPAEWASPGAALVAAVGSLGVLGVSSSRARSGAATVAVAVLASAASSDAAAQPLNSATRPQAATRAPMRRFTVSLGGADNLRAITPHLENSVT